MDINLPDCQEVYTFDYGIKLGGLVSGKATSIYFMEYFLSILIKTELNNN
jgi:hypothetical protein